MEGRQGKPAFCQKRLQMGQLLKPILDGHTNTVCRPLYIRNTGCVLRRDSVGATQFCWHDCGSQEFQTPESMLVHAYPQTHINLVL